MWNIEFTEKAEKQFIQLKKETQSHIKKSILNKLLINPNFYLNRLSGKYKGMYKFRVGEFRLICQKESNKLIITVIKVGNRKEVYKN